MKANWKNIIKYIIFVIFVVTFERVVVNLGAESGWKSIPLIGIYVMYVWDKPFFEPRRREVKR